MGYRFGGIGSLVGNVEFGRDMVNSLPGNVAKRYDGVSKTCQRLVSRQILVLGNDLQVVQ